MLCAEKTKAGKQMQTTTRKRAVLQAHHNRFPAKRERTEAYMSGNNYAAEERTAYIEFITKLLYRLKLDDIKSVLNFMLTKTEETHDSQRTV